MSDEEEDESGFKPGHEIVSQKATYTVVRLLGEGGFGAVYLCKTNKGTQCAMKVEMKMEKSKHSKLEMENEILKLVGNSKHFTKILDRGKREKEGFFFLAMELVGKSLVDLKAERTEKVFSFGTGLGVASQCLEAVEELHKHGFIHRDLKPANYACGLDDNKHTIYILDFGIARKYTNAKKEIKTPRETVGFRGTIRFASLSCHRNIEMGPKDDCESWFYLLLDLILVGGLPWKKLKERNEVLLAKEECRKEKRQTLYTGLKNSVVLNIILIYIDSQAHQDRVNYQFIYETLKEICVLAGHDIDAPYDWEISKNSLKVKPSPEEEKTQKNGSTIEGDMCREIEGKKTSRYEFYGILQSFMTTNVEQSQKMNYLMDQIKTKRDAKAHSAQVPPKNLNLFVEMLLWGVEESIRHCWNEQKLVDFNVRNLCDSVTDVLEALDIDVDDVKVQNSLFSRNRIEDKKKEIFTRTNPKHIGICN
ncbi:hypothetical protein CAEBREN_30280 [Caenorhabditis brenneri]|uniref:Protein kinase domain-containing protein n=1 Tax=Caenorhabditis brenneri TaxID=135651 RepID=G0PBF0_CAEBE|nr:hypothetical protein CAEBREN_30280 [Caenorhabditis brenneri]